MQSTIMDHELPNLNKERNSYQNELMQEVLVFENKVKADEFKLQGQMKTELGILND